MWKEAEHPGCSGLIEEWPSVLYMPSGHMSFRGLPSPTAVLEDLVRLNENLARWKSIELPALQSLPSVQPPRLGNLPTTNSDNLAVSAIVRSAADRLPHEPDQRAAAALLDFHKPDRQIGERRDAAAKELGNPGGGDSFRKGQERQLLRAIADEIYRGELNWSTDRLEEWQRSPTWFRMLEFERSLFVDPSRPTVQQWTTRIKLKAVASAHPLYVTWADWSGTGPEPGEVDILSGPKDGPHRHQLLRVRPASPGLSAMTVYVFDLGTWTARGQELELRYRQELEDRAGTFRAMIGCGTVAHPDIERITLRAKVPDAETAVAFCLKLDGTDLPANPYAAAPVAKTMERKIKRDRFGYFHFDLKSPRPSSRYELWWSDDHGYSGFDLVDVGSPGG